MILLFPDESCVFTVPLPYAPEEVQGVTVKIVQGSTVIEKPFDAIEVGDGEDAGKVTVHLAPDETGKLIANRLAFYQTHVNLGNGIIDILPAVSVGVRKTYRKSHNKCRRGEQAETYDGDYHIQINFAPITMLTKGKLMTDDVSIDAAHPTADVVYTVGAGETSITFTGLRNEPSAFSILYHGTWTGFVRKVACTVWQGGEDDDSKAIYRTGNNTNIVRTGGFSWTYNNGTLTVTLTGSATASTFDGTYYLCYDAVR